MKLNCSLACLVVQFGFVHRIQLEKSCRVLTCNLKPNINWRFIVYAMEIAPSEVAWLPVKVKGIQHMRVLRNYFNFVFVKRKSYEDHNLFLR